MKRTKKLMISVFSTFIIMLGIIAISNTELIFAKEDNIFYLDDLKEGDFIPNGATLVGVNSFHNSRIYEEIIVRFCPTQEDKNNGIYDEKVVIETNNLYTAKKYKEYFEASTNTSEYDGWTVMYTNPDTIYLKPAEKYTKIEVKKYKINASCSDDSIPKTTWYKEKEIPAPTLISLNDSLWKIENNIYSYNYNTIYLDQNMTSQLKFNFTAQKNDYFVFDIKLLYRATPYIFNGVNGHLPYQNYSEGYKTHKISIDKAGENEFIIDELTNYDYYYNGRYRYELDVFYLKNYKLLTPINEGNNLDITKVEVGDTVYYECECADGYIYNDTLEYTNEEESTNSDNKENTINPETSSTIFYVLILMGLFISTGIIIKINSKKI